MVSLFQQPAAAEFNSTTEWEEGAANEIPLRMYLNALSGGGVWNTQLDK